MSEGSKELDRDDENLIPNEDDAMEHENFLITPAVVKELWDSSRPKSMLIEYYQKCFKPKNPLEDEPMEYNELNIISEFQISNLVFAKNELLLDDIQSSYLLELFWNLLPIDNQGMRKLNASHNSADYKQVFDTMLIQRYRQGVFDNKDQTQILKIAKHANLFFKHFLLYDYVLNNTKLWDVKKIMIPKEKPKIAPNLNEALSLLVKNETEPDEDDAEGEIDSDY